MGIGANRVLRVLVVDDSAYARKTVREMLSRSPLLEVVGAARSARLTRALAACSLTPIALAISG